MPAAATPAGRTSLDPVGTRVSGPQPCGLERRGLRPDPQQEREIRHQWDGYPTRRMPAGWRDLLVGAFLELGTVALEVAGGVAPAQARAVWGTWRNPGLSGRPAGVAVTERRWRDLCHVFGQAWRTWERRIGGMVRCSAQAVEYTACNGDRRYRPVRCGSLFCLRCMRVQRARHRRIVRAVLSRFRSQPRMLTLTVPSWPRVTGMRRAMCQAFRRFRNLPDGVWKQHVRSAVAAYEHEQSEAGAHTHIHTAIDSPAFLPWNRLVVDWQRANGCTCIRHRASAYPQLCAFTPGWSIDNRGRAAHERFAWAVASPECPGRFGGMPAPTGVDIRRAGAGLDRELAKYVSKGLTNLARITDARELAELFAEFWGSQRLVRLGAARCSHRRSEDCGCEGRQITEEIQDPEREQPVHDVCGCPCWEYSGVVAWEVAEAHMSKQERAP